VKHHLSGKQRYTGRFFYKHSVLFIIFALLRGCAVVPISPNITPSTLNPQGPAASRISELWWVMFVLGTLIFVLVIVLMFAALLRKRRATSLTPPDDEGRDVGRRWVIQGGIILPLIVLAIVFGHSIYTLAAVSQPQGKSALLVHVIGRRWWWEVKYPDRGVFTANELHIPVGVPVEIELESADVIHSFWVPELHGKMDAIPTRINYLTIQADNMGLYRGECAEFCGLQHAHMDFMVVAESNDDFERWISAQQQPAQNPTDATAQKGLDVFKGQNCAVCHMVRGPIDPGLDPAAVKLGPDLTHFSSRLTLAGASLTNNKGNLAGWIVDSQHVKPGALMPENYIDPQDLQALLAYLETLR
jgi:cytochrome c oxidase subunit II